MRRFENLEENYTLEATFYWKGIQFDTVEEMMKCMKIDSDLTWEYLYENYLHMDTDEPEYFQLVEEAKTLWYDQNCTPFTIKEANKIKYNAEKKELILSEIEKNNNKKLENIK